MTDCIPPFPVIEPDELESGKIEKMQKLNLSLGFQKSLLLIFHSKEET